MTLDSDDVTALLRKWNRGEVEAFHQMIPLVYCELRQLARNCLRREQPDYPVYTGTLVHEAYVRLLKSKNLQLSDRNHFFAIAALVMRHVLVDEARRRKCQKRGMEAVPVSLNEALAVSPERAAEVIRLDEALDRLQTVFPRKCRVVELRYFTGLTVEQTAEVLGVSIDIVKREWRTAKMWLQDDFSRAEGRDGTRQSKAD